MNRGSTNSVLQAAAAVSWEEMESTDRVDLMACTTPPASPCTESLTPHNANITNTSHSSRSSRSVSPEISELLRSATDAFDDGQLDSFPDTVAPTAESEDLCTEDYLLLSPSSEHDHDDSCIGSSTSDACFIDTVSTNT